MSNPSLPRYAYTPRDRQKRFEASRGRIADLPDERFCRIREYYLVGSEANFLYGDLLNFQLQLSKSRAAVPLRRGDIDAAEREQAEAAPQPKTRRFA